MMKRLFIVDGQTAARQMLAETLARLDYEIVGEAGDGVTAVEQILEKKPEAVILEVSLAGLGGADVIRRLKRELPDLRFIVFSNEKSPVIVKECLKSGAHGFIERTVALSELLSCVRTVCDGGCFFGRSIAEIIRVFVAEPQKERLPQERLTDREAEVLRLIALGNSNKDIAESLGLSVKTVDNHRCSMMRKLDVHNVAAITRYAVEHRMVKVNFAV